MLAIFYKIHFKLDKHANINLITMHTKLTMNISDQEHSNNWQDSHRKRTYVFPQYEKSNEQQYLIRTYI